MNRFTISISLLIGSVIGAGVSFYFGYLNSLSGLGPGIRSVLNTLFGGSRVVVAREPSRDLPLVLAFLFACTTLFSFWWMVREFALRHSDPSVRVSIEI